MEKKDDDAPFSGPGEPIVILLGLTFERFFIFLKPSANCYRPDQSSWIWPMQVALVERLKYGIRGIKIFDLRWISFRKRLKEERVFHFHL